jgi:hypothetical protein
MTAFLEEHLRMRLLEIAAADFGGWNLRGVLPDYTCNRS